MSLYLKYRPQDFKNLVWQDFINNTLKRSILEDKTVWAYLFCGPRWTWKTSTARLFAKTINCENSKDWNPCLKCDICKNFLEDRLVDIIEIDAASHTWVDNIREIIEKANFSPTKTKYKVYIIDEVHMLSKWAFNALLKILEEPPKHVKFILATTETHKVPETIISRCQRYDFRKIPSNIIKERLSYIAKEEAIKIDKESLEYIDKHSWWGLRNAISLFEQLNESWIIKFDDIIHKLWIVSSDKLDIFLNKLINKDSSIIDDFNELVENWNNLKLFFKEFIFFLKDKAILDLKESKNITQILNILELLDETYSKTKFSLDENTTFLIWILKIIDWGETTPSPTGTPLKSKGRNKKEEITQDDIWDIFWEKEVTHPQMDKRTPPPTGTPLEKGRLSKWNFDKELFIKKLKESWAKSGLTMSIRGADLDVNWDKLNIKFKTGFALKQVNSPDNLNIMNQTLEVLWLNYKIECIY